MSVREHRELARTVTHLIGSSPELERRWIVTLDNPDTNATTVKQAVGATFNAPHPEVPFATLYEVTVNEQYEGNRYWHEVIAKYKIPSSEEKDLDLLPWQRSDVWKFATQGASVPALTYWDGDEQKPLTNSAGDYFEGLTTDEAQQKITILSNRQTFPSALAAAVVNCVNNAPYLGFPVDCVKVQGINGEQQVEVVNGAEVRYWKITSELLLRQSGWNLLLPDIGFNYLEDGERKRAYVEGEAGERLPSSSPVPLDGAGAIQTPGQLPAILTRRVHRRCNMQFFFGTPPS